MFYFMNWLTYEFWTRTGGLGVDYSHGAGTSSPSLSIIGRGISDETCRLDDVFAPDVSVQKLCVTIYSSIRKHSSADVGLHVSSSKTGEAHIGGESKNALTPVR